jgi:hypothetical protein
MKAIYPHKFFAPQKVLKVPRAYESLDLGLLVGTHIEPIRMDNFKKL